jgi:hypothetical protein
MRQRIVAVAGIGDNGLMISEGIFGIKLGFKISTARPSPISHRMPWMSR